MSTSSTVGVIPPTAPSAPTLVRWTHGLVNRVVRAGDVLALGFASVLMMLAPSALPSPLAWQQVAVVTAAQVWAFLSVMRRLEAYRVEYYRTFWLQHGQVLLSFAAACVVMSLALQACRPGVGLTEPWILTWGGLQTLSLVLGRQLQALHVLLVDRHHVLRRRVVVVGADAHGARVVRELTSPERRSEYDVIAVLRGATDDPGVVQIAGQPVVGGVEELVTLAQGSNVDLVVLARPWSGVREMFRLLPRVESIAADVIIPFEEDAVPPRTARLVPLGCLPAIQVASRPFKGTQGLLKAAEDYVVASVALLLLSPVMLVVAVLIRLDSPGPIFFLQPRVGFSQKPFRIIKFRTMTVDPDDDGTVGTGGAVDRRITRVGRMLRRRSLDELPQLFNVLRGEMSVVGPRPYVMNMLVGQERFAELIRTYAVRHRIKPGLTGFAQANGFRSAALRDPEKARQSVEMDLWYITNWSLWLDIRVMIRTIAVGLSGRHVY